MAVNVCAVTHLAAAAPQTLPKEAVSRKWVKIKVARVPNRNGDQRDEGAKREGNCFILHFSRHFLSR